MNLIEQIEAFNAGRDPDRLKLKYAAMRASPFAFFRGTCHLFYDDLSRVGIFKSAPLTWSCGDLHLENFGSYKGDNRLVYFDLNDFDEAALAPASWDLVRFLASLRVAADGRSIAQEDAERLCATFVDTYASALACEKSYWIERETSEGLVRTLLDELQTRQRMSFLDNRCVWKGKRRSLRVDGVKALPVSTAQWTVVSDFMQAFAQTRPNPDFYSVIDIARRIAGTGSLGVDRYAILIRGKGSPDANYLLDLKQALPSALGHRVKVKQPAWASEACRVVAVQRRMQAVSMAFLHPVLLQGEPFVLRALQPSEDRVTLHAAHQRRSELMRLVETMGRLTAWAQLRSAGRAGSATADELVDFGLRCKWRGKLLDASRACALKARSDALEFNAAYDAGALTRVPDALGPRAPGRVPRERKT